MSQNAIAKITEAEQRAEVLCRVASERAAERHAEMEQKAKADWEAIHQGDPNPYACLPKLNIFTYNLGTLYPEYADADIAFNFRQFFAKAFELINFAFLVVEF